MFETNCARLILLLLASSGYGDISGDEQHFRARPSDKTTLVGDTVYLHCAVDNLKGLIQWTKGGMPLGTERNEDVYPRYDFGTSKNGENDLLIHDVRLEDEDEYHCTVSRFKNHPGLTAAAKLTVLVPAETPRVVPTLSYDKEQLGLSCEAGACKPAARFTWFEGGNALIDGGKYTITYEVDDVDSKLQFARSTLVVNLQDVEPGTRYTCSSSNIENHPPKSVSYTYVKTKSENNAEHINPTPAVLKSNSVGVKITPPVTGVPPVEKSTAAVPAIPSAVNQNLPPSDISNQSTDAPVSFSKSATTPKDGSKSTPGPEHLGKSSAKPVHGMKSTEAPKDNSKNTPPPKNDEKSTAAPPSNNVTVGAPGSNGKSTAAPTSNKSTAAPPSSNVTAGAPGSNGKSTAAPTSNKSTAAPPSSNVTAGAPGSNGKSTAAPTSNKSTAAPPSSNVTAGAPGSNGKSTAAPTSNNNTAAPSNKDNDISKPSQQKGKVTPSPSSKVKPSLASKTAETFPTQIPNASDEEGDELDAENSSNFFIYFLSVLALIIAGYVLYHNKQKIMGILIEGRGSGQKGRRPDTKHYSKLSTNVEEAMTSTDREAYNNNKTFIY